MSSFYPSSTTPDEWEGFSCDNIAKAERERKASVALRSEINGILMQSFVDLRNIYDSVNNEFNKRIEETIDAKRKLEKEYAKVCMLQVIYLACASHIVKQVIPPKSSHLLLRNTCLCALGLISDANATDPVLFKHGADG